MVKRVLLTTCMVMLLSGVCLADSIVYDYIWPYYDGIAQFEMDGKIGILDVDGHVLVPAEYDSIEPMPQKHLRAVRKDGLQGFLDESWQLLHGKLFDQIFWLSDESPLLYFVDESGLGGIMDNSGEIIHPAQWCSLDYYGDELNFTGEKAKHSPFLLVAGSEGIGILNDSGQWVAPPIQKNRQLFYYDGLAKVEEGGGDVYKFGVVGPAGFTLDPVWENLEIFGSFIWVSNEPSWENQKWGIFNALGEMIISMQWDAIIKSDDSDTFLVQDGARYGFIDEKGRKITPAIWVEAEAFMHGYAKVKTEEGKWGVINAQGELIVPAVWNGVCHNTSSRVAVQNSDGLWGLLEIESNDVIVDFEWDELVPFFERLSIVKAGDQYGLLRDADDMILPLQHAQIWIEPAIEDSLYIVGNGNQYGYMNRNGEFYTAMDFEIDDLSNLIRAWLPLAEDGLYGWIPNIYRDETKGVAFVNRMGEVMLAGDWYAAEPFYQAYAVVRNAGGQYGLIDENGTVVLPIAYDRISPRDDHWFLVSENGIEGWISPDLEVVAGIKHPS